MANSSSQPILQDDPHEAQIERNAYRIGLWTGVLFTIIAIVSTISTIRTGLNTFFGIAVVIVVAILSFMSAYLSTRGKASLGSGILIVTILLCSLMTPILAKGQGIPLAVLTAIIVSTIASYTLQQPWNIRAAIAAIAIGLVIILLDLYIPDYGIPNDPRFTNVTVLIVGILYLAGLIRRYSAFPVRTKLVVNSLAVAVLSIGVVGITINSILQNELEAQIGNNLHSQANAQALTMGNSLASQIELIETLGLNKKIEESLESINKGYEVYNGNMTAILADMDRLDKQWRTADAANNNASPLIRAVLSNDMTTELVSFQKENPDHVEIFLTDKYGAIRASTNRTSDYYQADEDWWQTAFNDGQGGIYLGQPEYDESSQTFAVNIAVPINVNETGELVGVLRTTYKISALVKILASLRFGETGDAALVFPNGEILESTGNRLPTDADTLAQIKNIGTEYNQMTFQGKSRIITQSPISTFYVEEEKEVVDALGWTMIIFQDRSEALKTLNVVTRNAILVALSILILVSVVAYALSNNLARPILSLTETANQVRGGDFNARASVETQDEFKTLADTFNEMTERLRETLGGLEKRVEDRTAELQQAIVQSETRAKQLQSIADISRIITREQNLQRLLPLVADIVGERFGYYHVGIFLIDESRRFAVLQASNSAGGQQMLNSGHKLELATTSIVGYVALTSNPRIALDVGADAVFFNNPNLPETRSEMALPLNVRNVIIGVLDLQSTESSAFTQDDVKTLAVLADQVAIAIENARLIRETQTALEESRAVFQSYLKQEWSALATQKTTTGYIQSATGGQLLTTPVTENEIEQAIKKGIIIKKEKYSRGPDSSILAVPIKLGDQVLGAIRIQSLTKGHEWSTEEVNLVRAISERVGLAIENARLIENSQKRASKERAIGEISAKISTAAGMDSILETAVQELGRILSGSDVVIQFAQEEEIRQYDSQQE